MHEDRLSDTGRAEAFSDAVLAIIITLLVLDLRPSELPPGGLLAGLLEQWPAYFAYVTSFVHVGVIWTNHKAAFRRIRFVDMGLHWANLFVLFATAVIPFPTAVVADAIEKGDPLDTRTAVALYALVGVLVSLSWLVFFHYLARHRQLHEEDVDAGFFPAERLRALVGVGAYLAAGAIGVLEPGIALGILLALPIFYAVTAEGLYTLPLPPERIARPIRANTRNRADPR